jgi:hypothetical protein
VNRGEFSKISLSRLLFTAALWKMGASRLHKAAAWVRRKELSLELNSALGNSVLAGPFAGMILPMEHSWRDGDFMPKLLGTYESNLRGVLAEAVERDPASVVNVGCAEGYYAVGLARILPKAKVYAFDVAPKARSTCARAAEENSVADRVVIDDRFTAEHLSRILESPGRVLIVMDCEGAERELLDPEKLPGLARCDIIVETHGLDITSELETRFRASHRVKRIAQGARDPNELPELRRLDESDRWLLVDEGRPESMMWLACWADSRDRGLPRD